jgi:hypothetical protein
MRIGCSLEPSLSPFWLKSPSSAVYVTKGRVDASYIDTFDGILWIKSGDVEILVGAALRRLVEYRGAKVTKFVADVEFLVYTFAELNDDYSIIMTSNAFIESGESMLDICWVDARVFDLDQDLALCRLPLFIVAADAG